MRPLLVSFACVLALLLVLPFASAASPASATQSDEIERLRREIAAHDERYHREAAPVITDEAYDALRRRLAELEQGAPAGEGSGRSSGVGDDRTGRFRTRRHASPMLSLDKVYSETELRAFATRVARMLRREDLLYVVEPKLDGLAVSLTYVRGQLAYAVTRGNGEEGDDITANVRRIAGVPATLRDAGILPERVEIRGEIFVPFAQFERINAERESAGEPPFANPRNLAAGAVRQREMAEEIAGGLRLICYGLGACEPAASRPLTQQAVHAELRAWGIPVFPSTVTAVGNVQLAAVVREMNAARAGWTFPTDGLVVKLDAFALQQEMGQGTASPRWAVACKFASPSVETQVRAITIQVGRTGVLTPVAELEPVLLAGSRITRATLHNRAELARLDVRIGDTVYLEKAGEVIPAILGVNHSRRPTDARPYPFPEHCPACATAVERDGGESAVRCPKADCPAQVQRRLEHFASKGAMDIDGLGPVMAEALVRAGLVRSMADLYRLQPGDLVSRARLAPKAVERLVAAIERSRTVELSRVIYALGVPQVGIATARELARQHGSLAAWAQSEPRARELVAELLQVGVGAAAPPAVAPAAGKLTGKTIVLTGTLAQLSRAEASARIEAAGGRVGSSVTRGTDFVVAGFEPGTKLENALKLGVPVIDEAAFRKLLDP